MKQAKQVEILKELMRQVDEGKNIDAGVQYKMPTSAYVCPEIAAKEWDILFQNHPQLIGLSGDLAEPGSFLTIDDFGTPVLATRDRDGVFHAFLRLSTSRCACCTRYPRQEKRFHLSVPCLELFEHR